MRIRSKRLPIACLLALLGLPLRAAEPQYHLIPKIGETVQKITAGPMAYTAKKLTKYDRNLYEGKPHPLTLRVYRPIMFALEDKWLGEMEDILKDVSAKSNWEADGVEHAYTSVRAINEPEYAAGLRAEAKRILESRRPYLTAGRQAMLAEIAADEPEPGFHVSVSRSFIIRRHERRLKAQLRMEAYQLLRDMKIKVCEQEPTSNKKCDADDGPKDDTPIFDPPI